MPHAIREMGREVVRQENQDDPGKRSRLMVHRDVVRVLRDCSGTESVEGIRLNSLDMKESVTVKVEAFKKMTNLRFIQLLDHNSQLQWSSSSRTDDMSSFSFQKLRYLEWERFPCKCIDIDMGNVVFIKLQNSNLELLWERVKSLKELRILDVSRSTALSKIGSFTGLEKLEQLCLSQCTSLKELDSSIGCLEKLVLLDLSFCTRLKRFPYEIIGNLRSLRGLNLCCCRHIGLKRDEIIDNFLSSLKECCLTWLDLGGCNILKISGEVGSLKSLKYLYLSRNSFPSLPDSRCQLRELNMIDLSSCTKLESIPNLPPNIKTIIADDCISLVNLPSNISDLQFLKDLKLDGCFKLEPEGFMKVARLRNLKTLRMRNCNVALVSSEIGNMVSLQYLDLSDNTFSSLPDSFSNLSELFELTMNDCSQLQFLPLLPSKLRNIEASGCSSLDVIPYDSMQKAYIFRSKVFKETFFTRELLINLSVEEVPDWCSYGNRGAVLSFVAPMHLDKKICGVVSFATIEFKDCDFDHCFSPTMINETKGTRHCFSKLQFKNRCMCVMFYPLNDKTVMLEAGDSIIFQFEDVNVSSCGLSLIYESDVVDDSTLAIQNVIKPIG